MPSITLPAGIQTRGYSELLDALQRSKAAVVVIGAGVSASAGITPFRGSGGLYTTGSRSKGSRSTARDLLSAPVVLSSPEALSDFHDWIRELSVTAIGAEPTLFHRMLAGLAVEKRLLRLYSQNIDCLETRIPVLQTRVPLEKGEGDWPPTIRVHGGIDYSECRICRHIQSTRLDRLRGKTFSPCEHCEGTSTNTRSGGRRSRGLGAVQPRIVLYDDSIEMDSSAIASVVAQDLESLPDALIVAGTSLRAHSIKAVVETFRSAIMGRPGGTTIWLNTESLPPSKESQWTFSVVAEADEFARLPPLNIWDGCVDDLPLGSDSSRYFSMLDGSCDMPERVMNHHESKHLPDFQSETHKDPGRDSPTSTCERPTDDALKQSTPGKASHDAEPGVDQGALDIMYPSNLGCKRHVVYGVEVNLLPPIIGRSLECLLDDDASRRFHAVPRWSNNSCWADVMIVLANWLQYPIMRVDMLSTADQRALKPIAQKFRSMMQRKLGSLGATELPKLRDSFTHWVYNEREVEQGAQMSVGGLFDDVFSTARQFQYLRGMGEVCANESCLDLTPPSAKAIRASVTKPFSPRYKPPGLLLPTAQVQVTAAFGPTPGVYGRCSKCSAVTHQVEILYGRAPWRLVLSGNWEHAGKDTTDASTWLRDILIPFYLPDGSVEKICYRFRAMVHRLDPPRPGAPGHFYLSFRDDQGQIWKYDGIKAEMVQCLSAQQWKPLAKSIDAVVLERELQS